MHTWGIKGKEKALGVDHKSTLRTGNNLGVIYARQGRLAEAEEVLIRALEGYKRALGADHTLTLSTVDNLGNLCRDQGKKADTEKMYRRALVGKGKA